MYQILMIEKLRINTTLGFILYYPYLLRKSISKIDLFEILRKRLTYTLTLVHSCIQNVLHQ